MNLSEATALLGDSNRHFVDVYKLYNYSDTTPLKTYLEFVRNEPVEWMRGFPHKLRTHTTFALPKTAMIKLLKMPAVADACGEEFIKSVYTAVWQTYKKHGEAILEERLRNASAATVSQQQRKTSPSIEDFMDSNNISDSESIHSDTELPVPVPPAASVAAPTLVNRVDGARVIHFTSPSASASAAASSSAAAALGLEERYEVVVGALRDILRDIAVSQPGLAASYVRLLDRLV